MPALTETQVPPATHCDVRVRLHRASRMSRASSCDIFGTSRFYAAPRPLVTLQRIWSSTKLEFRVTRGISFGNEKTLKNRIVVTSLPIFSAECKCQQLVRNKTDLFNYIMQFYVICTISKFQSCSLQFLVSHIFNLLYLSYINSILNEIIWLFCLVNSLFPWQIIYIYSDGYPIEITERVRERKRDKRETI